MTETRKKTFVVPARIDKKIVKYIKEGDWENLRFVIKWTGIWKVIKEIWRNGLFPDVRGILFVEN